MTPASERLARLDPTLLAALRRRYAEPQRHYHTWAHIEALLGWFDDRFEHINDPDAVFLAIVFHDAIYDPHRTDNEAASAALLKASDLAGWRHDAISRAASLTLATAGHQLPDDATLRSDAAQFLDMDLSILGGSPRAFKGYDRAIRREYRHVAWPLYWVGRRRILRSFLDRPTLYFSEWGRGRFEKAARQNLNRKLRPLSF